MQETEWRHTQEMAELQQSLANAESRGAEAARFKAALGASEAECESLKAHTVELQSALASATDQLEAANERLEFLAQQGMYVCMYVCICSI